MQISDKQKNDTLKALAYFVDTHTLKKAINEAKNNHDIQSNINQALKDSQIPLALDRDGNFVAREEEE